MTKQFYLRMEGVNLSNFTHDTEDLSTIRGGGLLLLNSADMIKIKFEALKLEPISTGASSGLFGFKVDEADKAKKVRADVEDFLNTHDDLKHATFVVDVVEGKVDFADFKICKEKLIAMNRWRQMHSPSLAVPIENEVNDIKPCKLDGVRPANGTVKTGGMDKNSLSVERRKEFGKEQKKEFYKKQTDNTKLSMTFVNDLDELTADTSKGNLHHKMAVIYLDGNKFGDKQKGCDTPEKLLKFDNCIKNYRKKVLTDLLKKMEEKKDNGWHIKDYRLETLLWGGDELIWVVPAWKGWETLQFFYEQSKDWTFNDGNTEHKLTHAGGIVFCHHNAPIYRITRMAKELAEVCKKKMKADENTEQNIFSYQTLESFDHIAQDMDEFRAARLPEGESKDNYILSGESMKMIADSMMILKKSDFPRNKIYKVVKGLLAKPPEDGALSDKAKKEAKKEADKAFQDTIKIWLDDETKEAFEKLAVSLNSKKMRWLHIAELWDYIV